MIREIFFYYGKGRIVNIGESKLHFKTPKVKWNSAGSMREMSIDLQGKRHWGQWLSLLAKKLLEYCYPFTHSLTFSHLTLAHTTGSWQQVSHLHTHTGEKIICLLQSRNQESGQLNEWFIKASSFKKKASFCESLFKSQCNQISTRRSGYYIKFHRNV